MAPYYTSDIDVEGLWGTRVGEGDVDLGDGVQTQYRIPRPSPTYLFQDSIERLGTSIYTKLDEIQARLAWFQRMFITCTWAVVLGFAVALTITILLRY
jgi:hypothetical protein